MSDDEAQSTIFLSYAHADKAKAQRIASALEKSGYVVWWDALIEGGSRFAQSIDEALDKADAVVVLWSKNSIESDWVKDEASHARDRQRLVPISLDGSHPPLGFRQYQMIDLSQWRGKAEASQMDAVRRAIASAVGQSPARTAVGAAPVSRRKAMFAGGAAAATAAGGAIAWKAGLFSGSPAASRSIAVLPFKNLSGDPSQAFLSDGLTEEIRSTLSRNARPDGPRRNHVRRREQRLAKTRRPSPASSASATFSMDRCSARATECAFRPTLPMAEPAFRNGRKASTGNSTTFSLSRARLRTAFQTPCRCAWRPTRRRSAARAIPRLTRPTFAARRSTIWRRTRRADREARANFEVAIAADPDFALAHAALSRVLASTRVAEREAERTKASLFRGCSTGASAQSSSRQGWPKAISRSAMRSSRAFSTCEARSRRTTRPMNMAEGMRISFCSMRSM